MAKLTNIKERVQQPQRDSLIRTAGLVPGALTGRDNLFTNGGTPKDLGWTNLSNGSTLPSDQSMIILALRVFLMFRNPILRGTGTPIASNGDISAFPNASGQAGEGNAMGQTQDVWRLYCQSTEQIFWTFGAGDKPSISKMPTAYFPYGGGLVSDLAGSSNLIHGSSGLQTHGSMLKLARAIMLVPRQQINCLAEVQAFADGGLQATFGTAQGSRNMLSVVANLNAVDAIQKTVSFTFDGLLSRDVQLPCSLSRGCKSRAPLAHQGGRGLLFPVPCLHRTSCPVHRKVQTMQPMHPLEIRLQQMSNSLGSLQSQIQRLAGENEALKRTARDAYIMAETLKNVSVSPVNSSVPGDFKARRAFAKGWGGAGYASLDSIHGRFIPYDQFVEIPIENGVNTSVQGVLKISMEGPFVAARRYAVFLSRVKYEVTLANGTKLVFKGRTNGRFRGVGSNTDVSDAVHAYEQIAQYQPSYLGAVYDGTNIIAVENPAGVNPDSTDPTNMLPNFPGTGRPLLVSPLSMSSGRSMTFDGTIAIEPQGAQYNRQNIPVPSSLWTDGFNGPVDLSCYDVMEPGEEVLVRVNPLHINNPAYGNINGLAALNADYTYDNTTGVAANNPLPVGSWPFLEGQFDGHEGINDETILGDSGVEVDRVVRSFDGTLIIGYMGFRIVQAPGGV
jgi:hypothetical protein